MTIAEQPKDLTASETSPGASRSKNLWVGYVSLLVAVSALTVYAVVLQERFYEFQGPFYDSLSYDNFLARIMRFAQLGRWSEAINMTVHNSTVVLPWIQALLAAPFVGAHRWIGTVIQSVWTLLLACTTFRYFYLQKRFSVVASIALSLPFICMPMMFQRNGGLPDFRMDLLQYLLLSTASIQCLTAFESPTYANWLLFGTFAGITCLARATSPVYLLLMYGPICAMELALRRKNFGAYLRLYGAALGAALLICSWYFIANFDYLKYYYGVWNLDANRHLGLRKSLAHCAFVARDIGNFWLLFGVSAGVSGVLRSMKSGSLKLDSINWKALWLASVPCAFLVFIGAGLNEFVSMPSAFLLMFLLVPFDRVVAPDKRTSLVLLLVSLIGCVLVATPFYQTSGLEKPYISARRSGLNQLEDALLKDMKEVNCSVASVSCIGGGKFDNRVLSNTFMFDRNFELHPASQGLTRDGSLLWFDESLQYATKVDWDALKGDSPAQKTESFLELLLKQDYLFVPTDESAALIEPDKATELNSHVVEVRNALLKSGKLTPITEPIYLTPEETEILYRVERPRRPYPAKLSLNSSSSASATSFTSGRGCS